MAEQDDELGSGVGVRVVEGDASEGGVPVPLTERVASLGQSTAALMKRHVARIEENLSGPTRIEKRVASAIAQPTQVEKLVLPGDDTTAASNTLPTSDEANTLFTNAGAIFPPYDPETLVMLFEHSNALRSNVDSYVTNIEAFGHRFEPTLDLEAADIDSKIADAMFLERLQQSVDAPGPDEVAQAAYPTPEEVAVQKHSVQQSMRLEKALIENFIEGSVPESSFVDLRERGRVDFEVTGNAYWEVLRNAKGDISQFTYVPSHSVRLLPIQLHPIEIRSRQRVSALSYEVTTKRRRFRFFLQVVYNRLVYFKEYGDPRTLNSITGQLYPSVEAMQAEDPHAVAATELIHFRIHSPRSPYGIPRWIGNLLSVLGSRASEEVNYLYFDNKAVPPLAILVSGGRLTEASAKKIESYIRDHIKGKENFHRILIVEAMGGGGGGGNTGMPVDNGRVRIELERLTDAQQQDALFQNYDANNIDKLGSAFRLPRLVRGDVKDFNRSTAESSLEFAEMQVFQPERNRFDDLMNRKILPERGIRFWKFVSNTPVSKDPETMTNMIYKLVQIGVLTPAEGRTFARDVFNVELKKIDDDWTKIPIQLTLAGVAPGADDSLASAAPSPAPTGDPNVDAAAGAGAATMPKDKHLASLAANLTALRDKLRGAAKVASDRVSKEHRRAFDAGEVIMIPVPKAELDSWFEKDEPSTT